MNRDSLLVVCTSTVFVRLNMQLFALKMFWDIFMAATIFSYKGAMFSHLQVFRVDYIFCNAMDYVTKFENSHLKQRL